MIAGFEIGTIKAGPKGGVALVDMTISTYAMLIMNNFTAPGNVAHSVDEYYEMLFAVFYAPGCKDKNCSSAPGKEKQAIPGYHTVLGVSRFVVNEEDDAADVNLWQGTSDTKSLVVMEPDTDYYLYGEFYVAAKMDTNHTEPNNIPFDRRNRRLYEGRLINYWENGNAAEVGINHWIAVINFVTDAKNAMKTNTTYVSN